MRRLCVCYFLLAVFLSAQNIYSTINGSVVDSTGATVPGAKGTLSDPSRGAARSFTTEADGSFVIPSVAPGKYEISVQAEGVKGRDFASYLVTVPGVVDSSSAGREALTRNALGGIHINGGRDTSALMTVDGVPSLDAGNNGTPDKPNMDAIAEVKIMTSNYQAEYGRNGGGLVTVVTKSGSRDLHGSAYDYYRHESLNANDFKHTQISLSLPHHGVLGGRSRLHAWNHTQFSSTYNTARFDRNGVQVDPNFGAYSATLKPRNIQLSLKLIF